MNKPIKLIDYPAAIISGVVTDKSKCAGLLKWLLSLLSLALLIHFPDVVSHSLIWIAHTFYEATSFLLEELLRHTFGFDKSLAQLIVFYFSIIVGIGATLLFWRYSLRNYMISKCYTYKHQILYFWHSQPTVQKIKLILIQSTLMISVFLYLIT